MIPKRVDDISYGDIVELVENKVSEGPTLEYKQCLPQSGDDKREFLYDVSSLANGSGGDLIYGIQEERDEAGKPTGIPASIQAISLPNISAEMLRLENVIRDGIAPRILGIVPKIVESSAGVVVVLRVPKSWHSPHMVTFGGVSRFYSRGSAGKFPMDVGQLRAAFNATSSLPDRIRDLRLSRIGRIVSGETPVQLSGGPKLVLHVLPLSGLESSTEIADLSTDTMQMGLRPLYAGSACSHRYNFDGFVAYADLGGGTASGYVQLYRSGLIEAVDANVLGAQGGPPEWKNNIPSTLLERSLLKSSKQFVEFLSRAGVSAPIFIAVTLVGVKGLQMAMRQLSWFTASVGIDRDTLLVPEVTIEDLGHNLSAQLRPICDAIWRAAGVSKSPNFDDAGSWSEPR
jgi:hypothetical protein